MPWASRWVLAGVAAHACAIGACRSPPGAVSSSSTAPSAAAAPSPAASPSSVLVPSSASPVVDHPVWVGAFRATTSDPYVDAEKKTRYRTRHVLLVVQPDHVFRVKLTDAPVDDLDAEGGCETRGRVVERGGRLWAVEEATTCTAVAPSPREVALKVERVDDCLLRWVHERGGLSGGVLELGLRRRACAR